MKRVIVLAGMVAVIGLAPSLTAQGRGGRGGPQDQRTPKEAAPADLTGYWVSVVTEDWRYRMLAAPKGDYGGVPINAEARKVADTWDPAKDEASGNLCRPYGAAGIMRLPGRVHITWQDDRTLRMDTDAGEQTRLFHFGDTAKSASRGWQGVSAAAWEREGDRGWLKVSTTQMKSGYLRRNGVPYSDDAVLTEYYDLYTTSNGDKWFTVTTIVTDPTYLTRDFVTSTEFKQEPNGANWRPKACEMPLWPVKARK